MYFLHNQGFTVTISQLNIDSKECVKNTDRKEHFADTLRLNNYHSLSTSQLSFAYSNKNFLNFKNNSLLCPLLQNPVCAASFSSERPFKMRKSTRAKPSFVIRRCCELMQDWATVRDIRLCWSLGGSSVRPAGCFHTGFIHGTTIRRIRTVTDSNKPAHGLLKRLIEEEQSEGDKESVQVGLEVRLSGGWGCGSKRGAVCHFSLSCHSHKSTSFDSYGCFFFSYFA